MTEEFFMVILRYVLVGSMGLLFVAIAFMTIDFVKQVLKDWRR